MILILEGIDCTGKTSVQTALGIALRDNGDLGVNLSSEFPGDFLGGYLAEMVAGGGIIEFAPGGKQLVSETLVLFANDYYRLNAAMSDFDEHARQVVVFDRFVLGVIAYQTVRARNHAQDIEPLRKISDQLWADLKRREDPTVILLKTTEQQLRQRLAERGVHSEDYVAFLLDVQGEYEKMSRGDWVIFDGELSVEATVERVKGLILGDV